MNGYGAHVAERQRRVEAALSSTGHGALVLHAGHEVCYFRDDQHVPFRTSAHFAHWTPLSGPEHLLIVRPGERPLLLHHAPRDYWYEHAPLGAPAWAEHFDIREGASRAELAALVPPLTRAVLVGPDPSLAGPLGLPPAAVNDPGLLARLDWDRSFKTEYEVGRIEAAARRAGRAHHAARAAFAGGADELRIHQAYLGALEGTDDELPYPGIVALDEKGAFLHYRARRRGVRGRVLLIDSGATEAGYACDITRTWTTDDADPRFVALAEGLDRAQRALVAMVAPGVEFAELHHAAHRAVADLLVEAGILLVSVEAAIDRGLTRPFLPHGLGHLLGLQVHDVAGRQGASQGGEVAPPDGHPHLRTTRTLEPGMVTTIEPGLYFIEMLLAPLRSGPDRDAIDWGLIDALAPHGGIRIEDDVLVTTDGGRDLTRHTIDAPIRCGR
ncbi:MAG: Xaa-Pro dipeptidase [Ectothiorhodospiraceae bacterium]|nr:Xaa-Pro dipeptidase [Chromatiales bacterium]MCP5153795.1 Xaa-Pro dipeptidase [Ectothiorhodospiraceae bacterium]